MSRDNRLAYGRDCLQLKERVDERRRAASTQKNERTQRKDDDEYRQQPPFLVVFQKIPEFGREAGAAGSSPLDL